MRLLVYDVPALYGGALSVLKELYEYARNKRDIEWYFIINSFWKGNPQFVEYDNIKVIYAFKTKGSWGRRIIFDYCRLPNIVRQIKPDCIISLANVTLPCFGVPQYVYMHNMIPFYNARFSIFKNRKLWLYQKVIGRVIIRSLKRCKGIIVQTNWVKDAVLKKTGVLANKIRLCPPKVSIELSGSYADSKESRRVFFFPANMSEFKNHVAVVRAVERLISEHINQFEVIFTGNESIDYIDNICIRNLPIKMTGYLPHEEVMKLYTKSVLLFPSKLETFGIPLFEARKSKTIIVAGNTLFAHELLQGYKNAFYFECDDYVELSTIMKDIILGKIPYNTEDDSFELDGSWDDIINWINAVG